MASSESLASFDSLSDLELRKKLLEFGYDLPVSINRDFLIKKLAKVTAERSGDGGNNRRKSTPANTRPPTTNSNNSNATSSPVVAKNSRLSLNETGLRERQRSKEPEVVVMSRSRKSVGANSSPAVRLPSSRSSLGNQTTTTSRSTTQRLVINQHTPKLNRVLEARQLEEEEEEEDDDDDEEEDEEDMDIDEGIEEMPVTRKSQPSPSSYLTRRPQRQETSGGGGDYNTNNNKKSSTVSSSSRFQSYVNYFKGDTRSDPSLAHRGSPGRSGYYTPTATAVSPTSYRRYEESADEDEEEEEGEIRESRVTRVLNKVNPVNWIRNLNFSWFSSTRGSGSGLSQTESYSYNRAYSSTGNPGGVSTFAGRYSSTTAGSGTNGHFGLGNRIYSPAPPPPPVVVPPAMAAGRQAGFKAFFSRGERNGYGYSSATGGTTDWASSSHLISKIILAMFIVTFLGIGGIYYYKSIVLTESSKGLTLNRGEGTGSASKKLGLTPPKKKVISTSMVYPICGLEGVDPEACVPKDQIKNSRTLLTALKEELIQRSKMKGCGGEVEDRISLQSAKNLLYRLTDLKRAEVDSAFNGMLLLVSENINSGLKIFSKEFSEDEDISSRAVQTLDNSIATITAVGVSPNLLCMIWAGFYALIAYSFLLAILAGLGYLSWKGIMYQRGRKARDEKEMFAMIERILELLYQHYETTKSDGGDSYLAVNHIRDELMSARDRKNKEALWNQVVDHISNHESRVRMEVQHISGEEFTVWRWLPSASPLVSSKYSTPHNSPPKLSRHSLPAQPISAPIVVNPPLNQGLYPSLGGLNLDNSGVGGSPGDIMNKWQGQAFEMFDGSPNNLPMIPTTCLKIRQMFDTEKDSTQFGQNRIERAIVAKCPNSKILHIGVDSGSDEGCVYVLCQSKEDARAAYLDLHGWWFDGHLLSVKFLREQRYFARFPDAINRTIPLTSSNLSSPLSGQQSFANSMNIRSGNNNMGVPAAGPGTSSRARYSMGY